MLYCNIVIDIIGCGMCLTSKAVCHKFYGNLQLLERHFDRLCDRFTIVRQLEGRQLYLDSCYCQSFNQNGAW